MTHGDEPWNNPEKTGKDAFKAEDVDADDPHKAEKLAKAGRDEKPQEASE